MKETILIILLINILFFNGRVHADIVNPHEIYSYENMKDDLRKLDSKYSEQLSFKTIGYTHFGRKIIAAQLGNGKENILLIGAHHGREWMTSSLLMKMMETYARAYKRGESIGAFHSKLLDEVSIWFVPMLNPDGVTLQQGGLNEFPRYYRDNLVAMNNDSYDFTRWKANGIGVDLNRQYPIDWEKVNQDVKEPSYQFYKGKKPISTHETKAIVRFTKKIKPIIAVAYHTSGREIYWHYKNEDNLLRDHQIANKAAIITGYQLSSPSDDAIGAGYTDWFITHFHKPAMTIEISPLVEETNPPIKVFSEEWKRNQFIGMMLVKEAKDIIEKN